MINLLISGNNRIFDGAITLTLSIIKHCNQPIKLYIFTMDLTEKDERWAPITSFQSDFIAKILKRGNPDSEVVLVDVSDMFKQCMMPSVNIDTKYTPYTLLRLLAHNIIKEDKVAYIDIDILANDDIANLYNIDMTGYELGVVNDKLGQFWIRKGYFNAGVLLINLDEVRKTKLFDKAIDMVRTKKMMFPDQDALNRLVTKRLDLPMKFNSQGIYKPDTVLMHFCKTIRWWPFFRVINVKPWQVDRVKKFHDMTPFSDITKEFLEIKQAMEERNHD